MREIQNQGTNIVATDYRNTNTVPMWYLVVTAVVCGGLIMVVEVLGSRVVGPFFGVSLFVWTSLIAVTLIALAAGYAVGGFLADWRGTPPTLYTIIFAAGVLILLVPVLKMPVLKLAMGLGLRTGSFTATLVLFGPSLFLLGCVSPLFVKIAAHELANIGRTVGGFYALSTVGSVAGTILTGFFLIAYLSVDRIFQVVGGLLIGLAVVYAMLFRRRWVAVTALAIPLVGVTNNHVVTRTMPSGTQVTVVDVMESYYGNLKVVDYSYGLKHTRELIIDGLLQGRIDVATGQSVSGYTYLLEVLPRALRPGGHDCLVLGLGAGIIPMRYEASGVRTDVVEIDPEVLELAQRHFRFRLNGDVYLEDARYFLSRTERSYDYIILDVFTGDTTPGHVLSLEALQAAKTRLRSGGILAVNYAGGLKKDTFMTASVVKTLKAVFDQVDLYPILNLDARLGYGNVAILAYDGSPSSAGVIPEQLRNVHPMAWKEVVTGLQRRFEFPEGTPAMVLTDNYNPIEFFDMSLREMVRRHVINTTHWDVLIGS
jgi:spermidine synthase